MKEEQEHLKAISEIRSMMERSSRCISLSGLSGVFAGVFALIGAYLANRKLSVYNNVYYTLEAEQERSLVIYLVGVASCVLVASLIAGLVLTIRNSKRKGLKVWDATSRRLLINLMIPLVTGGMFALALIWHGIIGLVAPVTLIFYGLALINASKYTFNDIRFLGFFEVLLGLVSCFFIGYGLYFWAVGFGVLHILYGALMYFKYERS